MATQPLSDDVLNDTSGFSDNKAPETPTPASAVSADAGGDGPLELTEDQVLDDSAAEQPQTPEEKAENPVEKRIKGALKARDDARNALENERAAKAELERRLAAIESRMTPDKQPDAPAEKAPNPNDYEFGVLDEKYQTDAINFKVKAGVREALGEVESQFQKQQQKKAQQAYYQEQIDAAKDIVAKGAALYDDFEEVVWEGGLQEKYQMQEPTFAALRETDHPAEIVYALVKDPAEAARVAAMTPAQQAKYVFSKDAELASGKKPRTPKAAAPPGQQTRGASGQFTVAGDTDDLDAFSKEFFAKKR